jgi:hypothetical protein
LNRLSMEMIKMRSSDTRIKARFDGPIGDNDIPYSWWVLARPPDEIRQFHRRVEVTSLPRPLPLEGTSQPLESKGTGVTTKRKEYSRVIAGRGKCDVTSAYRLPFVE